MSRKRASKLYKQEVGKTFGLEKCIVVLHKLPKFDPMVSGTEDSLSHVVASSKTLVDDTSDDENYADTKTDDDDVMSKRTNRSSTGSNNKTRKVNDSDSAQGSKVSRPIGMKKAKKLAKLEAKRSRSVVEANGMHGDDDEGMSSRRTQL
jgi:hypothetical protein